MLVPVLWGSIGAAGGALHGDSRAIPGCPVAGRRADNISNQDVEYCCDVTGK
jgi:hypothetical protein